MTDQTTEAPRMMGTWCGRPIPRERRLEMGLECIEAGVDRAREDLSAIRETIAPSKRNVRFELALLRLEERLNAARQEAVDAREVMSAP